jgi:hypothetical protein
MSSAAGALRRMAQAGARSINTSAPKMSGYGNDPVRGAVLASRVLAPRARRSAILHPSARARCACGARAALAPRRSSCTRRSRVARSAGAGAERSCARLGVLRASLVALVQP